MASDVVALLAELDPLPFRERQRALVRRARASAAAGTLDALLSGLDEQGAYGRRLAVLAAAACRRADRLERALADPDRVVRRQALRAARSVPVSDDALLVALEDAPAAIRAEVMACLVAGGHTALAERVIDFACRHWGDVEAARLLPACGPQAAALWLPRLFHAVRRWRAVALVHHRLVLDEAGRQLAALPAGGREGWWERFGEAVAASAEQAPEPVFELLERYGPRGLPAPIRSRLWVLARADPARTIRLLIHPRYAADRHGLPATLLGRLVRQDAPGLVELGRALRSDDDHAFAAMLRAFPPSRREAFFDAVAADVDRTHTRLPDAVLAVLPRARREREARRMRDQARERGADWDEVLMLTAYLPVAEAHETLLAATRRAAAEERALAYALLVENAGRSGDREAFARTLAVLERLRNEQDPVRAPALEELSGCDPRLFDDADAEILDRIATAAIEARDSSWRTRRALGALAVGLLRHHVGTGSGALADWALRTIEAMAGASGRLAMGRLDQTLRRGQEHDVVAALRPRLDAAAERGDYGLVFALVRALGRRAYGVPALQDLLRRAAEHGTDATARHAIGLWLEDRRERDRRVAAVLELDASAVVLSPVMSILARRRTDLLDRVLGPQPPYGRFLRPEARWVPRVGEDVNRWTPRQQAAYAELLSGVAASAAIPLHERGAAIAAAARIPERGHDAVGRWLDSPDVYLAEAALGALPWTDRPAEVLPTLLARADGDRARVAVYAASRAARFVAPSALTGVLRAVLAGNAKVTGRKEAIRLAARLAVPGALALVVEAWSAPRAHRDVRIACVGAARGLLRDERAWRVLEQAAADGGELGPALLAASPLELAEEDRARYGGLLAGLCYDPDEDVARAAFESLATWAPWTGTGAGLAAAALTDLENRATWQAAAQALAALTPPGTDQAVADALRALAAADRDPATPNARADRDRPARRRLDTLLDLLAQAAEDEPEAARARALTACEVLTAEPGLRQYAAGLYAHAVDLDVHDRADGDRLAADLTRLAALHDGRALPARTTAAGLSERLRSDAAHWSPAPLHRAATTLAAGGDAPAGLLAVALTTTGGEHTGWSPIWCALLRDLRSHFDPDVRDAALAHATAPE